MKSKARIMKLVALVFAVVMMLNLLALPVSVYAETSVNDCVRQMIVYYKEYQNRAETDIQRLLDEMAEVDAGKAKVWGEIMEYWHFVNTEMEVNINTIPDDLPTDNSVAIVILGYALNADGSMRPELVGRLETGLQLAQAYPNAYVVVTGGGTASAAPDKTEGGVMGDWLLANGLSEDRLIIEDKAPDTVGNAKNTYKILSTQYPQVKSYVMVTSDYHVPRGSILFQSKNLLEAYEAMSSPLNLVSNAGYYTGSNGYESVALQAQGVASVAGVSLSGVEVKLSQLSQLDVAVKGTDGKLDLDVTATYHNGYTRDVTEKVSVSGFDASQGDNQTVTVSYTENGITVSGSLALSDKKATFFSTTYLDNLVKEAEAEVASRYTAASFAVLTKALADAKAVLAKSEPTLAEVGKAYDDLNAGLAGLVLLPNIAYKKPTATNSSNAYPSTNINDGTKSTANFWASMKPTGGNLAAKDAWLTIDLDGTYDVEAITVYPYWNGGRIYKYVVYGSTDGETWTEIAAQREDVAATTAGFTHEIDATVAHIKLQGISTYVPGRGDITNMHIIEMEVFGSETNNLCLNKVVSSSGSDQSVSSSAGATSDKINDGDRTTFWDGGLYADEPFVTVDMGGLYLLDEINVIAYWMRTDNRYYRYEVYTSIDGKEFTKVGEKTDSAVETILGTDFDLTDKQVYARYVKVVGVYNSANTSFHINEVRAFGTKVAEDIRYVGLQTGESAVRFVGTVEQSAIQNYDKVDLAVTFTEKNSGETRSFTCPTNTVYQVMNDKNGAAVAVKDSKYAANLPDNCVYDAAALFAYGISGIAEGSYSVTVTPVAYVGETAIFGMAATYSDITVAADGSVTVTK